MRKTQYSKRIFAIAIAILAAILISSSLFSIGQFGHSVVLTGSITAQPLSTTATFGNASLYGDPSQYEWPMMASDESQTSYSAGPGPNTPDIAWKTTVTGGSGYVSVFSGKAFVLAGTTLRAFDANTGASAWNATLQGAASGTGGTTKIDDQYLFVTRSGVEIHKISDGSYVANLTLPYWSGLPGSAQYFPGAYSSTLKMKYGLSYDPIQKKGFCNAISVADPTHPTLAWTYTCPEVSEIMSYGDGRLFLGTTQGTVFALNASTGDFLWEAPKTGVAQQSGFYYAGNFYQAASSQVMTCYNATTGKVNWEYDSGQLGTRGYFAYRGAAGYGRVYDCSDSIDPNGWVLCWDAFTGTLLWKQPAYYNIHYATMCLADGKLYGITCDSAAGRVTAGLTMPGYSFTCFDAFTGTELWTIPNLQFSTPTLAYGKLYGIYNNVLYCIGQTTPAPWSLGFQGNADNPRIAVGQAGPTDLSAPKWVFATGGKVGSSAAVADGKVYIGSDDRNVYCLDAYTGAKIWNFTTGAKVESSVAVVSGRVYTGTDDGNVYCLDGNTGAKLWTTPTGGLIQYILMPQELQKRSCPTVVGNSLYVGALDGKVYCLNIADGRIQWTYTTGGPIGGSPLYNNGVIYITSTDTYLYALNSATGSLIWRSIPLNLDVGIAGGSQFFNTGTPVLANGIVYVPAGVPFGILSPASQYQWLTNGVGPGYTSPGGADGGGLRMAAFNAATGQSVWNQTMAGNSGCVWQPAYYNGQLYVVEYLQVDAMNATFPNSGPVSMTGYQSQPAGNRTWKQWLGYQIEGSVLVADRISTPVIYVGSDVGSVTCLNATNGSPISVYQTGANIESTPSLWEDKLYIGSTDRNVYCFDNSPVVGMSTFATANKGGDMWSNETLLISGQLTSNPNEMTYNGDTQTYVPIASQLHPGLPNATVLVTFTKPDGTSLNVTTITDSLGFYNLAIKLNDTGSWGWAAYYQGLRTAAITYNSAYTAWHPLTVTAAPIEATPTPVVTASPTPVATETPTATPAVTTSASSPSGGIPAADLYAIVVVVIVIVIVAVVAYMYMARKKKPA